MEQTRICSYRENDVYMKQTIVQRNSILFPWEVRLEGWKSTALTITIVHSSIGAISFSGLKLKSARHFAEFTAKMLKLYRDSFKKPIVIEAIDVLELMEGYRKGAKDAQHAYIDTVSLI